MQYLIPNEKDKIYVSSIVIGAVSNVIINYLLIPRYRANGAAIGTLCAEAIVMLIQTIASSRQLEIKKFVSRSIPFLINGIFMLLIVRFVSSAMGNTIMAMLLEIAIGAFWYLSFSVIYFYRTKNELFLSIISGLKRMIRK